MKAGYKESTKKKSRQDTIKGYAMPEGRPTFSITSKELADITKWKVGETYSLEMTVKQTGLSQNSYDNGVTRATFEIVNVKSEEND